MWLNFPTPAAQGIVSIDITGYDFSESADSCQLREHFGENRLVIRFNGWLSTQPTALIIGIDTI